MVRIVTGSVRENRRMNRTSWLAITAAATLGVLPLTGCKKNAAAQNTAGTANETASTADFQNMSAVELYQAKQFQLAKDKAEANIPKTVGREREVNQLTAGCACHALNQPSLAQHYLVPLTGSKDPQIAGRAEAVLGQIAQKQGNHKYAADLFKRASEKLDGDDAARASVRAGNSLSAMGNQSAATRQYQAAAQDAQSDNIKKYAQKLSEPGPFTIQAGVFSSRANADKRANELKQASLRAGLGLPRIVTDTVNGKPAFAVQIGTFVTRTAASQNRSRLGTGQFLVVAAD